MKIGVFTCWCGEKNCKKRARNVDCEKVAEKIGQLPGVHYSLSYKYMCFEPG